MYHYSEQSYFILWLAKWLQNDQRPSPTFVTIFLSITHLTTCIVKIHQHYIDHLELD